MEKFQEKPKPAPVVEAVKFTGDVKEDWIQLLGLRVVRTDRVYLVALDGPRRTIVEVGDWVIFAADGRLSGMSDKEFKANYTPYKEPAAKSALDALK